MEVGDIILYRGSEGGIDYSIVTDIKNSVHWAYWVEEKQIFTFSPATGFYTKVGPSILGKWND